MSAPIELHITERDWDGLRGHLFPGNGGEHGAALLCGTAVSERRTRLLVRDMVLAEEGRDYVRGRRSHSHLSGEFVTRQVRRARDENLVYLAVHNHGGTDRVSFSGVDMASHERGYPTLTNLTQNLVGGLVLAQDAIAGDLWFPTGSRAPLNKAVVVGRTRRVLTDAPRSHPRTDAKSNYDRQTLLFGEVGQALLAEASVAVVGVGGIGMLLVLLLSRLGVGRILVIDPDRVEPSNLSRLPAATRRDAMLWANHPLIPETIRRVARRHATKKVNLARRIAHRANPEIEVLAIPRDVADQDVAARLTDCDFIFLAADSAMARNVVNQVASQYIIPALQVGSKAVTDRAGGIRDIFSAVRHLGVTPGCLLCNGLVNTAELAEAAVGDEQQRRNQRYVDDPEIHAPSVITLNAVAASWAANDFMLHTVGLGGADPAHRLFRNRPLTGDAHVTVLEPDTPATCHVCGSLPGSVRSRGDSADLPTRLARRN